MELRVDVRDRLEPRVDLVARASEVLWSSEPGEVEAVDGTSVTSQEHRRCCGAPSNYATTCWAWRPFVARASEVLWSSEKDTWRWGRESEEQVARASEVLWSSEPEADGVAALVFACRKSIGGAVELRARRRGTCQAVGRRAVARASEVLWSSEGRAR